MKKQKQKKQQKKRNKYKTACFIFLFLLLTVCFFAIGVVIIESTKECEDIFRQNIIVVYSAALGSFITLFGVFLTIVAGKKAEKERRKLSHIPEFFLPDNYDLAKTVYFCIGADSDNMVIPNHRIYIQNTDKTDFIVNEVVAIAGEQLIHVDNNNHYIDKRMLFCLSFYNKNTIDKLIIKTNSIDDEEYHYEIDLTNKTIRKKD